MTGRPLSLWLLACLSLPLNLYPADSPPLAPAELGLMLRGGYSSDEVLREVVARHIIAPPDPAADKALRDAGADQRLFDALHSGRYTLAAADSAAAIAHQQENEARLQADRAAGQDRLLAQARAGAQAAISRRMSNQLRGKLTLYKDGSWQPYDDNVLATKKVFALYFSAAWCGPCRQFTPQLVQFYKAFAPTHPEFEVILISADHSAPEAQQYVQADGMPWPMLDYARIANEPELTHYAGAGIPCLVLLDGAGGVLSDSYAGAKYLGPRHVLDDLARMAGVQLVDDEKPAAPVRKTSNLPGRNVTLSGQPQ